jgi:hypothetical protein
LILRIKMAYSGGALALICEWQRQGIIHVLPTEGIFELGAQEINPDVSDEEIWSFIETFYPEAGNDHDLRGELARQGGSRCHMSTLAKAAGLPYIALDLDVRPGTVRFDLNFDRIEDRWRGAFKFTTSQGTLEHVANQVNCLAIMHEVTGVGGVIMLNLPLGSRGGAISAPSPSSM